MTQKLTKKEQKVYDDGYNEGVNNALESFGKIIDVFHSLAIREDIVFHGVYFSGDELINLKVQEIVETLKMNSQFIVRHNDRKFDYKKFVNSIWPLEGNEE